MNATQDADTELRNSFLKFCGADSFSIPASELKRKTLAAFEARLVRNEGDALKSGSYSDLRGRAEILRSYADDAARFGVLTEAEVVSLKSRC